MATKPKKKTVKRAAKKAIAATPTSTKLVFKVLRGDESCSGGSHKWSLPKNGNPGDWHSIGESIPLLCSTGFHVTEEPAHWMQPGCTVYIAETRGAVAPPNPKQDDPTKHAAAECRLVREATADELAAVGVYLSGSHVCRRTGKSVTLGNSKVDALGNSNVVAWENSKVVAWENSKVEAWGDSKVVARENSNVVAWGNSNVVAQENSKVVAWGNSNVVAWGNSNVVAWGNSNVVARENSNVVARENSNVTANNQVTVIVQKSFGTPTVTLEDRAAEVNWSSGWAKFRTAATKPQ